MCDDLLRRAAQVARETDEALGDNRGPWYILNRDQNPYPQSIGNIGVPYCVATTTTDPAYPPAEADHIVRWHPGVARRVIAMLDCASRLKEPHERESVASDQCAWCGYGHLEAIAQALLGEESDGRH